mmetsp:Transcript_79039/g.255478  ORF Transcript_79039/g.255478 Transcript_79039/m.255478 type:complete len:111 (-) Transcript_79039:78-410(-)
MVESKQQRVVIRGEEPKTVRALIEFMFLGKVSADEYNVELIRLADSYQMGPLFSACLASVMASVTNDNIVPLARLLNGWREKPEVKQAWAELLEILKQDATLLNIVLAQL